MKAFLFTNINIACLYSRYRSELMGVAIIGVLIGHWFGFQHIPIVGLVKIPMKVTHLVFTQGFLFLSGYGLYYSFCKNANVKEFYKRRIIRLLLPFMLIASPFLIFFGVNSKEGIWDIVAKITTIAFWYKGNYCGMWYVAISMLLYFIYPLMHKIMFYKNKNVDIRSFFVILLLCALAEVIRVIFPDYYALVSIGVSKLYMFPIGMYVAYLSVSKSSKYSQYGYIIFVMLLWLIFRYSRKTICMDERS